VTNKLEKKYYSLAYLIPLLVGVLFFSSLKTGFMNITLFLILFELLKVCISIFLISELTKAAIIHFGTPKQITEFLSRIVIFLCLLNFCYAILSMCGVDGKALKSASAILAFIIGVASKQTISNMIAGVFLSVENSVRPFDFIVINKYAGLVVDQNLFYVTLEDGDENRKKIESKNFYNFNNASLNLTTINVDAKVSVKVPMEEIDKIVSEVLENSKEKFPTYVEGPEFLGIEKFRDGKMYLRFTGRCKGKDRKKSIVSITLAISNSFTKKDIKIMMHHKEVG
jgi:small conductance mechanosensitive channel